MTQPLTDEERRIYAWQIDIPGFGEAAQERLKASTVLVSRCGGLGGPAAQQLAAAGVGRIVIAHAGTVRESDLNRQILQRHERIGLPRRDALISSLRGLNPRCVVEVIEENASEANAERLVAQADVVIDAAPLFVERFALNDACVRARKPMVEAAVFQWEAQVTTIQPGLGPCLRCICPAAPAWWQRRFPILGAVSATAGSIAAAEAVKLLTGQGQALIGRMLRLDLSAGQVQHLKLARDPACPACAGLRG